MSNGAELDKLLAEAAEKIRREAYSSGWRDAIAAINKAAAGLGDPAISDAKSNHDPSEHIIPNALARDSNSTLTPGTTPHFVFHTINKQHGMTGSEIVSKVKEGGHRVADANIRTAIFRLKQRKLIVSRHGRWFPLEGK